MSDTSKNAATDTKNKDGTTGNWKDIYFLFWTAPLGMVEPSNRAEYSQRPIHIFRLH